MQEEARIRTAFWGGTFDPPHNGHLGIARAVLTGNRCDKVLFIPAYAPPHKDNGSISPYEDRLAMLRLAVGGEPGMAVSDAERRIGVQPTYTFRIAAFLEKERPDERVQILIGGDSLAYLHTWHRAKELVARWEVLTYPRREKVMPDRAFLLRYWTREEADKLLSGVLEAPFFEISSTEVRKKVAKNENTATLIPEKVAAYIKTHRLYAGETMEKHPNE